jgi:hypothetical protein
MIFSKSQQAQSSVVKKAGLPYSPSPRANGAASPPLPRIPTPMASPDVNKWTDSDRNWSSPLASSAAAPRATGCETCKHCQCGAAGTTGIPTPQASPTSQGGRYDSAASSKIPTPQHSPKHSQSSAPVSEVSTYPVTAAYDVIPTRSQSQSVRTEAKPDVSLNTNVPAVNRDMSMMADITPAKSIFNDDVTLTTPVNKKRHSAPLPETDKKNKENRSSNGTLGAFGKFFKGLLSSSSDQSNDEVPKAKQAKVVKADKTSKEKETERATPIPSAATKAKKLLNKQYEQPAAHWAD